MTHDPRKALADRLDDYAAHADLADKGSEAVDLRDAAAALRAPSGTAGAREEVAQSVRGALRTFFIRINRSHAWASNDDEKLVELVVDALTPSHEAGTQRNVAHEDCLNCHCSDESLCAGTEPRSRKMVPEIPFDPMDHHNALLCPYCNPQGLKFAESGTQDARVPKVRTNHHRNKEEAARLQALVTERYARDGAGTQEPVAGTARSTDEEALALVMNMLQWIADTALAGFKGDTLDEMTALSNINNTTRDMIDALAKRRVS